MNKEELAIEKLEQMKKVGFAIFGESFFKDTLAYVQIQRKLKELEENKDAGHEE